MTAFFDWYTAGVSASPELVINTIRDAFDLSDVQYIRPMIGGYENACQIRRGEDVLAKIQYGGASVGSRVWVNASGHNAHDFADLVRDKFPLHHLIRADVAIDYDEPGAWDSLSSLALSVADRFRLKVTHVGDFHRGKDGRTINIGSRTSAAMQRIYEKGKQLGKSSDWVRQELELKPQTDLAKLAYARATPEQMFQATKWTRYVWEVLNGPSQEVRPAPPGSVRVPTDDERALEFMAKQYGNVLRRKLESLGGDYAEFGLAIAMMITPENGDQVGRMESTGGDPQSGEVHVDSI
jgi:hypothetical protein